jgi:lipoic acid synthetase
METLIPDFKANTDQLDRIIAAKPEIISHNLETVRRLTRQVRIQAQYDRSLETLTYLKAQGTWRTKSGIMLGLGETEEEVLESMMDLRKANVDVVTMGQYLQPTPKHLPVKEFVHPDVFNRLAEAAKNMGFIHVESGPLVRSSYHAEKHIR